MLVPITDGDYPQHYGVETSLTYYWDVPTLDWVKGTQASGGGGGAATIADGADVAEGATTDAAVTTDTTGTVSGKLRGLVKWAYERMPAALGQTTMAASLPVVVASNQSAIAISAAALPLPSGASTAALQTQPGVDIGDVTVNNAAGASAVNVQDGGNSLTVDAASLPLPTGAATSALQTQPGVDIGDVTVNNAAGASAVNIQDGGNSLTVDGTVAATQSGTWSITANETLYAVRLDEASPTITYVGSANPGTLTSAASWGVKRLDSTAGLIMLWADGNANFDNIWDDRAILSYS